ncbi:carboxymuconolactone decarboxylase family protein [Pantoea osteomyelitidis]|uniref:Carboxymuconolactone decarboxylase family protein n=1 Tax=Pantoea osteomyelitidis TaxID=3230026 RepID=A0ABW7Q0K3_9GAMM
MQEGGFQPVSFTPTGDRYARGFSAVEKLSAGAGKSVTQSLRAISPDLSRFVVEFSYGDVLSRNVIDNRTKELAIIAMLTAMGTASPQLKVHISAALNVGVTEGEIIEVIQQMAIYAGFPAALNGVFAAQAVFSEAAAEAEQNRQ